MKKESIAKLTIVLIFLMLISVPFVMRAYNSWDMELSENREEIISRYGFYLDDVTLDAGVDFVHKRPVVDEKLHHILPQISSMGASVSVVDFNNDGFQDFYLTSSEFSTRNALYKNNGDGSFTDVAVDLNLADLNKPGLGSSMGSVWGDINNNGYEDLLVYRWGKPELFINEEGNGFTKITEQAGLPDHINANTAIWFDYDRDGYLDLFIGGYFHEDVNLFDLEDTRMMPDSYEFATNGGRNYLLRNLGDGTFEDVSDQTGITENRKWTLAAGSADIDEDGWPDLVLANDYGVDEILINQNGRSFISAGEEAGIGFVPKSGMSVSFGDILNRGELSIYITNISEAGVLMQGNNLWVPSGHSSEPVPKYRNVAGNMGVEIGEWGYAGKFADLNNDGNVDIYVANGYVSAEPGTDYWYDYAKVVGGNRSIIMDAKNWPAMNNRSFSGYQSNKIWLNDGGGRFREVANAVGGELKLDSRSVATADLFGSGAMDFIVANQNGAVKVYKNNPDPERNWIGFDLSGSDSNRSAIGAEIIVEWDGKRQKKIVSGGEAFSSQSQRPVHFGLGNSDRISRVEIRWPSGTIQEIEQPELNMYHLITE